MYQYDAQLIVDYLEVNNTYLSLFIISAVSGVSAITAVSYFATLYTLAQTSADPLLLGVAGGLGIVVGDIFYYYLGHTGRSVITGKAKQVVDQFSNWLNSRSDSFSQIIAYIYTGFTPLPNDILMLALSFGRIKFKKIIIPVIIGSLQLSIGLAYLFSKGFLEFLI